MNTLLERAKREGTPLIDGEEVTFVWEGARPPALMNDVTGWWDVSQAPALQQVEPGVWTATLTVPRNAFIEYAYAVDVAPGEDWNAFRALDPLNSRAKWNGISAFNNYFYMPEAQPTPLIKWARGIARGTLTRHKVKTLGLAAGTERAVKLYQPPTDEPSPLVLVLDGYDYVNQGKMPAIVDNLIAQNRIHPIALVMPQNGRDARTVEYGCADVTYSFFHWCLRPLAAQHLHLIDVDAHPGAWAVMGASMGGLMSLYLGLRNPHIFGRVLSQSGAFTMSGYDMIVYDLVQHGVSRSLKIWMDCGCYDFLIDTNRRMAPLLQEKGYDVTYQEYVGGHNYYAWRDDLADGLIALFGR